jgi:two-component system, OmpR family, phosphate regulon response regulator PhoB
MLKKILVADDDPDILNVVKIRLEKYGYRILTAENGAHAICTAVEHRPDLIILDIKMPGGNGLSVYDKLKNNVETAFIPVIFFTAHPSAEIRKKVLEWGASNFIAKPFTTRELILKVKYALYEDIPPEIKPVNQINETEGLKTLQSYSLIS